MQPSSTIAVRQQAPPNYTALERTNPYFQLGQLKKAIALADTLGALGISSAHAELLPESERRMIAKLAGELPPRTSWPVAIELLRDRELAREKFANEREVLQAPQTAQEKTREQIGEILRRHHGSQARLTEMAGVKKQSVSGWLNNPKMTSKKIQACANELVAELLEIEEIQKRRKKQ